MNPYQLAFLEGKNKMFLNVLILVSIIGAIEGINH